MSVINPANPKKRGSSSTGPDLSNISSMSHHIVTLKSTLWLEDGTQTADCSGVLENDNSQLLLTIPDNNDDTYFRSNIRPIAQLNEEITFKADTTPETDVVVNVYIFRAAEIKEEEKRLGHMNGGVL